MSRPPGMAGPSVVTPARSAVVVRETLPQRAPTAGGRRRRCRACSTSGRRARSSRGRARIQVGRAAAAAAHQRPAARRRAEGAVAQPGVQHAAAPCAPHTGQAAHRLQAVGGPVAVRRRQRFVILWRVCESATPEAGADVLSGPDIAGRVVRGGALRAIGFGVVNLLGVAELRGPAAAPRRVGLRALRHGDRARGDRQRAGGRRAQHDRQPRAGAAPARSRAPPAARSPARRAPAAARGSPRWRRSPSRRWPATTPR